MKKHLHLKFYFLLMCFSLMSLCVSAQNTINGKIMSTDGEPLVGVSILVKGTTNGTVSDLEGNFQMQASEGDVLVFSYTGMKGKEMVVGKETTISVEMSEDASTLSDIVVTATRQPIRKIQTTTAISTIGKEEITLLQPESFGEAIQSTPGVTVENSQGRKSSFNIRGFPSGNTYVTTMLDGLPLSGFAGRSAGVAEFHGLDRNVERVEVVRGSGATLFGRAAAAGAVNIITKTGGEKIGGEISITKFNNVVGDDHQFSGDFDYRVDFNINGPIADKLRFNVGGYVMEDSGYKEWAQKDKGTQFRANFDYLISEKSSIRIYGMWGNNQFNNLTDIPYNLATGEVADGWENFNTFYPDNTQLDFESTLQGSDINAPAVFLPAFLTFPISDADGNNITQNQVEANREEVIGGQIGLTANIDLGGGFRFIEKIRFQTFDWRDQNEISLESFYTVAAPILRLNANSNGAINDIVNETRLEYNVDIGNSKHNFSLGFYFSNAEYDRFGGLHWYTSTVDPSPTYGWFGPPGTPPLEIFTNSTTTSHQEEGVTSFFFGDEMVFNEKLRINAGIRYDKMTGFFNNDPEEIDGIDFNPAVVVENDLEFDDFSGSIGVNYMFNQRSAIYGSFLRAFSLPSVGLATPVPEKNEIVINGELGYRVGVGDLGIDVGVFNTVIDNRLATVFDPDPNSMQTFVVKPVGKNTVRGGELQLTYAPSQVKGLLFRASFTLQQSEFDGLTIALDKSDDDDDETTPDVPDVDVNGNLFGLTLVELNRENDDFAIDVTGNQVHNTPTFIFSFNAGYTSKYFGVGFDALHYGGRYVTSLNLYETPDLTILNANIFGQYPLANNSKIRLGLRIKNLLDTSLPQQLVLGSTNDDLLVQQQATPNFNNGTNDILGFGISQIPRRILLTIGYDF